MNIRDAYSSKAIAVRHNEGSKQQAGLSWCWFVPCKEKEKQDLTLKWIKTSKACLFP